MAITFSLIGINVILKNINIVIVEQIQLDLKCVPPVNILNIAKEVDIINISTPLPNIHPINSKSTVVLTVFKNPAMPNSNTSTEEG